MRCSTSTERSYRACGRTVGCIRRTVSRLWARISGRASMTTCSASGSPLKSPMSASTEVCGRVLVDRSDRLRPDGGTAVGEIVAVDAGDDDVREVQLAQRAGDAERLPWIGRLRAAGLDVAEPAGAGAGVAQDHDRRRAARPALADVGAGGFLADRVELVLVDERLQAVVPLAAGDLGPDPVGLAAHLRHALAVSVVEHQAGQVDDAASRFRAVSPPRGRGCRRKSARGPRRTLRRGVSCGMAGGVPRSQV